MTTAPKPSTGSNSRSVLTPSIARFAHLDIGAPGLAGDASPVATGWDVRAGGEDIWEKADQFHFIFRDMTGDFDVAVRVESFAPAHLYSKAGLMVRESLTADSAHLMFVLFANNAPRNNNLGAYELQFRAAAGGACQAVYPAVRPPAPPEFPVAFPHAWLRVTRRGNEFAAFASTDGQSWKLYAAQVLALANAVKVGPALTSHHPSLAAQASFRDYTEANCAPKTR